MFLELASEKAFELLDGCFDANNEELEELLQKLFLKQGISLWKVLQVVQMKRCNQMMAKVQNCTLKQREAQHSRSAKLPL